jgi:hypothetical protein
MITTEPEVNNSFSSLLQSNIHNKTITKVNTKNFYSAAREQGEDEQGGGGQLHPHTFSYSLY